MSEEEKKAIEWLKKQVDFWKRNNIKDSYEEALLNRLEQLEKENKELKDWKSEQGCSIQEVYELFIPKSVIREKIEELEKYENMAKEQLGNEAIIITDSVSLNWGRAEAHYKDIQALKELLGEEK